MISTHRWHGAGTYDVKTKSGGPFGTIRCPEELAHEANKGLDIAVNLLEPVKQLFPNITYADFYQVLFIWKYFEYFFSSSCELFLKV